MAMALKPAASAADAQRVTHRPRTVLTAVLVGAALLSAAPASARIQIGISEQSPGVFANKYFGPLKMRYGRIVVPWDVATLHGYWPRYLSAWLAGAKFDNVEPHVAFGVRALTPRYYGKGPSPAQYAKAIRAFRKRWPHVHVFSPWNEENHVFQVTAKHPRLAVEYYKALKRICPFCRVLGADMLDDQNLSKWLRRYQAYARQYKIHPRVWGLHNYQDANHHRSFKTSWTYKLTKLVKGDIWSTEAGGLVGFKTVTGRIAYRYSPTRARKAQHYLFTLMANPKVRARYKRVYVYNFFGSWSLHKRTNRWDSGLIGLNGKPRPAYADLKKIIAANAR
ncbi:MAG: hypothetical protein QOF12_2549 [Solirubrobacteraceae bacterium]|jgi:hypothetical protein|nr:hypothetical protein [Solirubrobacteraceae bacterium]